MRINHNIAALNTYRQLTGNTNNTSKSLEKLSSGLRINRAGDDAAGLAISEKMRSQIRGLDQASRNANDGISLIQTAEGALNETHAILQRMRELAVQASTDTNTAPDRAEIQKEMDQLRAEIDRIGDTTEFNTMKLVNGSQSQRAKLDDANAAKLVSAKAVDALKPGDYTVAVAEGSVSHVGANVNGADTVALADVGSDYKVGDSFKINITMTKAAVEGADPEPAEYSVTLLNAEGDQIGKLSDQTDLTAELTFGSGESAISVTIEGNLEDKASVEFTYEIEAEYTVTNTAAETKTATITSNNGKVNIGGFELEVNGDLEEEETTITVEGEALQLQVGANENQSIRLSIGDMRAEALKINDVTVDTHANAKKAITTLQSAIDSVSSERSKLGAMQNRLEHTIKNLDTSAENLQASEGRIRDVDMAKEMMEFTKNNILSQASQAMLAQANMQPQSVLQLLQ
ncbi:MAG TPA: flagellin [Anaerovoracaceae bacterium]|nr:flagellin [Anaerovoracaceae bacterium]